MRMTLSMRPMSTCWRTRLAAAGFELWWLPDAAFDLNGDSIIDQEDHRVWVKDLEHTWFGDADLNGEFNSKDFVQVFQAGKYETAGWTLGQSSRTLAGPKATGTATALRQRRLRHRLPGWRLRAGTADGCGGGAGAGWRAAADSGSCGRDASKNDRTESRLTHVQESGRYLGYRLLRASDGPQGQTHPPLLASPPPPDDNGRRGSDVPAPAQGVRAMATRWQLSAVTLCVILAAPFALHADIYRWDNGQVIPGTEGIEPGPGVQLDHRQLECGQAG